MLTWAPWCDIHAGLHGRMMAFVSVSRGRRVGAGPRSDSVLAASHGAVAPFRPVARLCCTQTRTDGQTDGRTDNEATWLGEGRNA